MPRGGARPGAGRKPKALVDKLADGNAGHRPHKVLERKAFMGKALLILQATGEKGTLTVRASGEGLRSNKVEVICY